MLVLYATAACPQSMLLVLNAQQITNFYPKKENGKMQRNLKGQWNAGVSALNRFDSEQANSQVIVGQIFGDWCVVSADAVYKNGRWYVLCKCTHTEKLVSIGNLYNKQSSGCRTCFIERHAKDPIDVKLTERFRNIRGRCRNPNNPHWRYYGGRGITVAQEWVDDPYKFAAYIRALPDFDLSRQFDRIDNNLGYIPGNIRMVDSATNNRNKRNNRLVEWNNESIHLTDFVRNHTKLAWGYANRLLAKGHTLEELAAWNPAARSHKGLRHNQRRE